MSKTKLVIILGSVGLGLALLAIIFVLVGFGGVKAPPKVTLQFWGVYDEPDFYRDAISQFEKDNRNISVIYKKINFSDYEKQVLDSFAAGTGPDVWLIHNTWLPKHGDKIQPMPDLSQGQKTPLLSIKDFKDQFVDAAFNDLTFKDRIYALPIYVDTLGLYYNKDVFNSAGIASPPKTWDDFVADVKKLTEIDNRDVIVRSGAAIGTSKNINRSTDILSLLMLQSGVQMTDRDNIGASFARSVQGQDVGETALRFYTDFANSNKQVYSWNNQQHYSVDAFVNGETAMMINYSHQVGAIRDKSPRLNFATALAPQLTGSNLEVNYASYWAPAVAKQSKYPDQAWQFLAFLASKQGVTSYLNVSNRPSARRDLLDIQKNDPDIGPFASQALSAKSWYQIDNSAIEKILSDAIDSVNFSRASVVDALRSAESQVTLLMSKSRNR